MHAEYAWSRRLVPCEPVDMWCACNWTGGQSVWLSKTHFWQPKRRLQSTFGSQRVFANGGLDNRHWNQPLFHSKHPFFENPNSKVLGMPINMQKLFGCSFPWSPFNLLEGGKQSPPSVTLLSFQHNAPELWLICGGIKGLWVLPEQSQTQSLCIYYGDLPAISKKATLQTDAGHCNHLWRVFQEKCILMSYLSESIACPYFFFLTDSRFCKMLVK